MVRLIDKTLFGVENELMTAVTGRRGQRAIEQHLAFQHLFALIAKAAPSLYARDGGGVFNAYGRIYLDPTHHLELATCEVDSPYQLTVIAEQQQMVLRQASQQLAAETGIQLVLANNTASGVFRLGESPTWAGHANYLVEQPPASFGPRILPFLATRVFAGEGILGWDGSFYANPRAAVIVQDEGGATQSDRALHSTAREEHHVGALHGLYRYHTLCGGNHRSHFNLALHVGSTAAALKAILFNPELSRRLPRWCGEAFPSWSNAMQTFNLLARPGQPLRVDPRAIEVQRVYLQGAREYVDSRPRHALWLPRLLDDWEQTLDAMESQDDAWLRQRLDAWAKHALLSASLAAAGRSWTDVRCDAQLAAPLALVNDRYHELTRDSLFDDMEQHGLLNHRVAPRLAPGGEPEPYVPRTSTRARVRARFIRKYAGRRDLCIDWSGVSSTATSWRRYLYDPFATTFTNLNGSLPTTLPAGSPPPPGELRQQANELYERGEYDQIRQLFHPPGGLSLDHLAPDTIRTLLFAQARWGAQLTELVDRLHPDGADDELPTIADLLAVYRFSSLGVSRQVVHYVARGRVLQRRLRRCGIASETHAAFNEHLAFVRLRLGRPARAEQALAELAGQRRYRNLSSRIDGRILATYGDVLRVQGHEQRARELQTAAEAVFARRNCRGELADFPWINLGKLSGAQEAVGWFEQAKTAQRATGNRVGLARTLLIESRKIQDADRTAANRDALLELRSAVPALTNSTLLTEILDRRWQDWLHGPGAGATADLYWGL